MDEGMSVIHSRNTSTIAKVGGTAICVVFLAVSNKSLVTSQSVDLIPIISEELSKVTYNISASAVLGKKSQEIKNIAYEKQGPLFAGLTINEDLVYNLRKLSRIADLKDNWNGNGAKAFTEKHLDKISNLLLNLNIQPEVFPTAADSIQLEYEGDDGAYLEFQVYENDDAEAEVFCIDRNGYEKEWKVPSTASDINGVVNSFYG